MSERHRLMVTGAHGFVAGAVIAEAGSGIELHALTRGQPLCQREGLCWHQLELSDYSALCQLFETIRPHAILHIAAAADIDFCQANPEIARRVNVDFTRSQAELCRRHNAKLVLCSTDSIFDGEHAPYREEDAPSPINTYAETKVEAERLVSELGGLGVVARLSLVIGLPVLGAGNSFLAKMIASLKAGRPVIQPAHEIRTPVDVITVARALLELAEGAHHGIFHLAGNDRSNRFDMACRIAARLGLPESLISPTPANAADTRAPRPRDVSLDNSKARIALKTPMIGLDEGLQLATSISTK